MRMRKQKAKLHFDSEKGDRRSDKGRGAVLSNEKKSPIPRDLSGNIPGCSPRWFLEPLWTVFSKPSIADFVISSVDQTMTMNDQQRNIQSSEI
jgi:hypothetical protein